MKNGFSEGLVRIFVAAKGMVDYPDRAGIAADRRFADFWRRKLGRTIHLHAILIYCAFQDCGRAFEVEFNR